MGIYSSNICQEPILYYSNGSLLVGGKGDVNPQPQNSGEEMDFIISGMYGLATWRKKTLDLLFIPETRDQTPKCEKVKQELEESLSDSVYTLRVGKTLFNYESKLKSIRRKN